MTESEYMQEGHKSIDVSSSVKKAKKTIDINLNRAGKFPKIIQKYNLKLTQDRL